MFERRLARKGCPEAMTAVPLVYRNIQKSVDHYCAVEVHLRQWDLIMLDGKMVIEARYSHEEINDNGRHG